MADLAKTVEIIFGGQDNLSPKAQNVLQNMNSLDATIGKISDPLASAAESILKIDAALAALSVGGIAYAIKTVGEFNGKFGEITTLISDTGAPIAKFKEDVKAYATDSVKSIADINQAIYTAVSAGVSYKDSIAFVSQAEKLAVAGRAELGDTTKALASVLNAYGEKTDQAGKYSDSMFTTVKLGLTTMTELSASLSQVTGLAANAGIPLDTLSAAIAALTSSGMPTAEAITSIKSAIQNIIKPTDEAQKMAASLGIEFNATSLKTKGFETVLWDAYKATGGSTEKMAQLFGSVEALNGVLVLASDKTGQFKTDLAAMADKAGATAVAYGKVVNEFKNINQRLLNSFLITIGEIGEKIMPEYGQIAGKLGDLFKGIKVGVDTGAFDPLFRALDDVLNKVAGNIAKLANKTPEALKLIDWSPITHSLSSLSEEIARIFSDNTETPKKLAESIQRVIDTIGSLIDLTKGLGAPLKPFLDGVEAVIDGFNSMDSGTKTLIGNVAGLALQYKLFGPTVTTAMLLLGSDSQQGARDAMIAFAALENGINILKIGVIALGLGFAEAFLSMAELLNKIPGVDMSEGIARNTTRVGELSMALDKAEKDMISSTAKLTDTWNENTSAVDKAKAAQDALNKAHDDSKGVLVTQGESVESLTKKIEAITVCTATSAITFDKMADALNSIPAQKDVKIGVQADGSSIEKAYGMIIEKFPDGSVRIVQAQATLDAISAQNVQKKLDEAIPKDKFIDIQAKLDEAKIKASSEVIQKSIEWKAKIDIAQVEADTKKLEAVFGSLNTTITSTGNLMGTLSGNLQGTTGGTYYAIEQMIKDENQRRIEALSLQKDLTKAEIDNINARTEAMRKGDSLITIDGKGLQPHLEAFMFEILAAIQVRANAEGQKFLVGL